MGELGGTEETAAEPAQPGTGGTGGALAALAALDLGEVEPAVVFDARWAAE